MLIQVCSKVLLLSWWVVSQATGSALRRQRVEISADSLQPGVSSDVSLMITATEKDINSIPVRIPRLMAQQHFNFQGNRYFVLDTRGEEPSSKLLDVVDRCITQGFMDSWIAVNYSDAYVAKVGGPVTWAGGRKGRLVYFFMLDWSPTRYVVHYDLDIALWSKPGYSWISAGLQILSSNAQVLEVQPPLPNYQDLKSTSTWTTNFTCRGANFITGRYFLMDRTRYLQIHKSNGSASERIPFGCLPGPQAWEVETSCAACRAGYQRADLLDAKASWVLHFPHQPTADLSRVLDLLVAKGKAVPDNFQPYNAADLHRWLQHLPANISATPRST
eukprot:gnl/MRDRNA2_/MRDRNA2_120640_c0_seq1.p1 gnl/MRDRNA2_/MRDRNA2_120640_c0~~gnl/MRDRNA2_/MRDRNA2_120640_c0_seq1.p1  ORF type:complete len:331 (-),score=35.12 gnl/MRDRNA2_/MRDRNA2_120640_c0_seq1:93-1085(-)